MENTCKFYKIDLEVKAETERMEALFHPDFLEDESIATSEHTEIPPDENDPFSTCGAFCRYLASGKDILASMSIIAALPETSILFM